MPKKSQEKTCSMTVRVSRTTIDRLKTLGVAQYGDNFDDIINRMADMIQSGGSHTSK